MCHHSGRTVQACVTLLSISSASRLTSRRWSSTSSGGSGRHAGVAWGAVRKSHSLRCQSEPVELRGDPLVDLSSTPHRLGGRAVRHLAQSGLVLVSRKLAVLQVRVGTLKRYGGSTSATAYRAYAYSGHQQPAAASRNGFYCGVALVCVAEVNVSTSNPRP